MVTQDEQAQAADFLKRAEVKTMRKDLAALRESDALKERDKIAKIKTLEEQLAESAAAKTLADKEKERAEEEKAEREEILTKHEGEERIAEKDLKNYASEQERQQIFLFESQRLGFEKQIDAIDKEKDPALKLEKNGLLLQKREQQAKLDAILEEEKKLETEQKFITEKEQTTTVDSQRKSLQQSRQDLERKIEDVEKKRWAVEKEIQDTDNKIKQVDNFSEQNVIEKNKLKDQILGVDKSLRDIYSGVMVREEEKRKGMAAEEIARKETLAKARVEQKERIQRQQWAKPAPPISGKTPESFKKKLAESTVVEEQQREKFLQDMAKLSGEEPKNPEETPLPLTPEAPIPPVPHKK